MGRDNIVNTEAARDWDGPDGEFWAEHHERFDGALARHHARLLEAAAIATTDRILDIGCGNGQTTCDAARRASAGHAVGIDLSSAMLAVARRRAAGAMLTNVTFLQGDAQAYAFEPAGFDLAISRTGTMFFADPVAAFTNIRQALLPGGRFVQLVWQSLVDNEWIVTLRRILAAGRQFPAPPPGAPGPFALAEPDRVRQVLTDAGFVGIDLQDVREPVHFGRDTDEAYGFLSRQLAWLTADLDEPARQQALADLRVDVAAHVDEGGVDYGSAAWLITAIRP